MDEFNTKNIQQVINDTNTTRQVFFIKQIDTKRTYWKVMSCYIYKYTKTRYWRI